MSACPIQLQFYKHLLLASPPLSAYCQFTLRIGEKACSFLKKRTKRLLILRRRSDTGFGRMDWGGEKARRADKHLY
jgi:hypothetical protein